MPGRSHPAAALSEAMLREFNDAVLELNDPARSEEELFGCLVDRCRSMIPHSSCSVVGIDRQTYGPTMFFGPWAEQAAGVAPSMQLHIGDHPCLLRHSLSSVPLVDAVSGHVSQRQWRSTGMFDEAFKGIDVEDQIAASQPYSEQLTISLVVNRDGWGFRREESVLLSLLLPHVGQALRTRAAIRRLEAVADMGGERQSERVGFQVVTDRFGHIVEPSDECALQQLWDRFGKSRRDSASRLPGPVCRWLRETLEGHFSGDESTLRGRLSVDLQAPGGERFHLRLLPGSPHGLHVLVIERRDSPEVAASLKLETLGLSPRRAQVLYWVAEGKSNGEIAAILGISLSTVKNHLRAIYDLLLVENRHAAALAVWRMLRGDKPGF